jgi:succinate dehydrogenase flavin-adding protein (antitoxin of CptAB toxin-antitoxin module)
VPEEEWKQFLDVLKSQDATLRNSIMNEEGPIKKEKAEKALNSILSVLENYIWQNVQKAA